MFQFSIFIVFSIENKCFFSNAHVWGAFIRVLLIIPSKLSMNYNRITEFIANFSLLFVQLNRREINTVEFPGEMLTPVKSVCVPLINLHRVLIYFVIIFFPPFQFQAIQRIKYFGHVAALYLKSILFQFVSVKRELNVLVGSMAERFSQRMCVNQNKGFHFFDFIKLNHIDNKKRKKIQNFVQCMKK